MDSSQEGDEIKGKSAKKKRRRKRNLNAAIYLQGVANMKIPATGEEDSTGNVHLSDKKNRKQS